MRRQGFREPPAALSATRYTRRKVSDNIDFLAQPKEQLQPKIWLKLQKNPNQELNDNDKVKENDYCDSYTHMGHKCKCHEADSSDWAPHNHHLFEPQVT